MFTMRLICFTYVRSRVGEAPELRIHHTFDLLYMTPLVSDRSVDFAPVVSFHGDVIRFGKHEAYFLKGRFAW